MCMSCVSSAVIYMKLLVSIGYFIVVLWYGIALTSSCLLFYSGMMLE